MSNSKLFASFSGGETSALMRYLIGTLWRDRYDEVVTVFANTGQENEETLEFVRDCDRAFDFKTTWVEAVVRPGRAGTTHRIVDFASASRSGEPFEATIRKYGIPNQKFPHCTREMKQRPMISYVRSLGWKAGTYDTAIGIRADETGRRSGNAERMRIVYPLLDWLPTTKPQVNTWWRDQPVRLNLAGYQGNCKTCWKKSFRKLLTVMDDEPTRFDFFERMESCHGAVGAEFQKETAPGYHRVFFRGNLSVGDLRRMHANDDDWQRAENDAIVYADRAVPLDVEPGDGCTESCEVDFSKV
jgi:3'-phosphoadenosine 5'-phosphosulfate sulfotransferase (PAPS reductase)/FAD synthetase